jgi:Phage gp6-like head-tail connector protein
MKLISIEEARAHLRIDEDVLTEGLTLAVAAANASVSTYLKRKQDYPENEIPDDVKMAALLMAGYFIRDPDGADTAAWQQGYLPFPVIAMCYPYRDPSFS